MRNPLQRLVRAVRRASGIWPASSSATSTAAEPEEAPSRPSSDRIIASGAERIREIRQLVLAQAGGDMMGLRLADQTLVAVVPRAPFWSWALHRTSLRHLAPEWRCVCQPGMRLIHDDPYHSDWFFGATLIGWHDDPTEYRYDSDVDRAANREMFELQYRLGRFECQVVVDAGEVIGRAGAEIAVVPDLHPERMDQIRAARGIVTEAGGSLAHMAQLALEKHITILRLSGACERLPVGTKMILQPEHGTVRLLVERR
jgi:phosphohistidine swiveling domain-containing protein